MEKEPIKWQNAATYVLGSATVCGFAASAGPALANNAHLTTTAGLIGVGVGAAAGFIVGLFRRFR